MKAEAWPGASSVRLFVFSDLNLGLPNGLCNYCRSDSGQTKAVVLRRASMTASRRHEETEVPSCGQQAGKVLMNPRT